MELLVELHEFALSRVIVRERKIYRDAIAGGRGVIEMRQSPRSRPWLKRSTSSRCTSHEHPVLLAEGSPVLRGSLAPGPLGRVGADSDMGEAEDAARARGAYPLRLSHRDACDRLVTVKARRKRRGYTSAAMITPLYRTSFHRRSSYS
jgi:hypothetical protein